MTSPSAPPLDTTVVPFTAGDGMALNLHHVTGPRPSTKGPVILVHGAGVRADIFRAPEPTNVVDALVEAGWDVWLENWRASIDLPPNEWDLDQAAVHDHPKAVEKVLAETGADSLPALVHCQGSTSFVMSAVAGLVPEVHTIVSNAVSLHPVVPRITLPKLLGVVPLLAPRVPYIDPQWGVRPPEGRKARAIVEVVRLTHHECDNIVCRMVSFTYGTGFPCLWSHANLSDVTHEWLSGEFAAAPLRFFRQIGRSVRQGHLVSTGAFDELPTSFVDRPPRTDARFVLFAGKDNRCFLPRSQEQTFEYLRSNSAERHRLHELPGYGHLDVFMGRNASSDVFPKMLDELDS